ncbi:hypothetical protein VTK73DRAFT_8293 [Phialemonium thermophilum]|uniref:Major facilitator superfamily (MFS) profile domain-containing protein n=1 Tax=Phialemonium thermophilum TaxID=223376 RepID=A0ABR3W9D0_9PEZI
MAGPIKTAWSKMTPLLLFSCFCLLTGDVLFGYDTSSFGGILANPGFLRQFAPYHEKTKTHAFDSTHTSLISSLPFIGKFLGCLLAGPAIEKFGHRPVFQGLSVVSVVGIITGHRHGYAQFLVGRIIVYISVGLVEVDVTTYQAEIVPGPVRGLVVVSLQLFLNAGNIVATGVNKAFSKSTTNVGWQTVTGIQFLFPILIVAFTFFIPDSPRWLLSKDRDDEALAALCRLRSKEDVEAGHCQAELGAIKEALQEQVHKAPWTDLFRGANLRRTLLVVVYYFFQQTTGQAFISTYQTTFYKTNGFAAQAFTYPVINSCLTFLAVLPGMYLVDVFGRRPALLISFFFQAFWIFMLAGLGGKSNRTSSENNTIVASFMLFAFFYNMSGASVPYLLGSEIPNSALREKTQSLGTSWNVVWAFVTNFVIPYIIADIHFGVGWVFGGISVLALVFTFFFLPETKGRALEEIDAIFEVPFNPFRKTAVPFTDAERRIGAYEGEQDEKPSVTDQGTESKQEYAQL